MLREVIQAKMTENTEDWADKAKEFLHRKNPKVHDPTAIVQILFFNDLLPDRSKETLKRAYKIADEHIKTIEDPSWWDIFVN